MNPNDTNWVSGGYLEKAAGDTATISKFNDAGTAGIDTFGDMSVSMDFSLRFIARPGRIARWHPPPSLIRPRIGAICIIGLGYAPVRPAG